MNAHWHRWCGRLTALCCAWLLQGCSSLQLGYNQAPTLGYWWLDSQLSLESRQGSEVRAALQKLQQWHRDKELADYAQWLEQLRTLSAKDTSAEQVCALWEQVQQKMDRTLLQAIQLAAPIAQKLQAHQLRHLLRHWEDKNADWEKDWLAGSPEQRTRKRLDRLVERYNDFYGELSEQQTQLLQAQIQKSLWTPQWGRLDRLRRQQSLLQALQTLQQDPLSAAQAQAQLLSVWQQWFVPPQAQDRQLYQRYQAQNCQHLAELHNSTSSAQRQRAARRLKAYETDLRELAER